MKAKYLEIYFSESHTIYFWIDFKTDAIIKRATPGSRTTRSRPLPYTNIQHTSTLQVLKKTLFNNVRYTTNIPTDPHTIPTTDKQTNTRHIHTSIVSRHLTTRGNNKILRTPPPHISSSEERLPRFTRCTLAQLRTNKSPFLNCFQYTYER